MNRWLKLLLTLVPLFVGMLSLLVTHDERMVAILMVAVIGATFWIQYEPREWIVLVVGIGMGLVLEVGGDLVYQLQHWQSGMLWGIPLWLPLFWGYGFVIIRRAGAVIVEK